MKEKISQKFSIKKRLEQLEAENEQLRKQLNVPKTYIL